MENNNDYAIVQMVQGFLGRPKSETDALNKEQWQFNCPGPTNKCRHDIDKYNLEYNAKKHVFKCWKCGYVGYIYKLIEEYGTQGDLRTLKIFLPRDNKKNFKDQGQRKPKPNHHLITCELPEGYLPLARNKGTKLYKRAWNYLVNERKVSPYIIDKYQIGYTETGNRRFRIIIPSRNELGNFNYYEARSYMLDPKIPYIKPSSKEVAKNDIIFNENFINWDLPIFLVEGVFDMFRLPNSIPILGKEISPLLTKELVKRGCTVILCFDPDAIEKTVETYTLLTSLGLNVFYVDLDTYNEAYVKQNFHKAKKKEKNRMLKMDVSEIYEERGKGEIAEALKNIKRLDLTAEIIKRLEDEQ